MSQKREKLQVIYDILRAIQEKNGKIKPTHILYKANLSHQMLAEYINDLKEKGFISETTTKEGKTYELTEKGFKFLGEYQLVLKFTQSFGIND